MKKILRYVAMATFSFFLMAGNASAIPIIDFNIGSDVNQGSISYAGGVAPLVGTGIMIDYVKGLNTPSNNNAQLNITGGILNFTTGPQIGPWAWGPGSSSTIIITGAITALGISPGSILMTGSFLYPSVYVQPLTGNKAKVAYTDDEVFWDVKNVLLLNYYGLPNVNYAGNFNISFNLPSSTAAPAAFSGQVGSGDVANHPVPEPGSMLLLGLGLCGLCLISRKKK